jgi:hypothetical protein
MVDEDGDYVFRNTIRDDEGDFIPVTVVILGDPSIVKVEAAPRPLPTEWGTTILARTSSSGFPVVLRLGVIAPDPELTWMASVAGNDFPVRPDEIEPTWRVIDSDTLTTVDDL